MQPRALGVIPLVLVTLAVSSCAGGTKDAAKSAPMVVDIVMQDNRYEPAAVTVPQGREVTFRFVNKGTVKHEALVGDEQAQEEHAQEMAESKSSDDHDDDHDHDHMAGMDDGGADTAIALKPGESDEITTSFARSGEFIIGCHEPGHYEDGMRSTVTVN